MILSEIEDFLKRADKYGLKTEFVFFNACWHQLDKDLVEPNYQYPPPLFGVHNSRWLKSPGEVVLQH